MNEILSLLNPWWTGETFETGIIREKYLKKLGSSTAHKRTVLLIGSRRVGKTTILHQLIAHLLENTSPKHILYALVDHPQLSSWSLFDIVEEHRKNFKLDRKTPLFLFFDEVQYLRNWEQEVKALLDTENVKIFLSGSASTELLIKGTYLTGRIEKIEVDPLDFKEFLAFKGITVGRAENYKYEGALKDYLRIGGYPEYVLEENPSYLSELVNNILYKDIVTFYQLRNPDLLKELLLLISDRVGSHTTYNKLAHILALKNDTIKEYIYYLKNTLLVTELTRFSSSRAHRIYGPKKFYLTDNGLLFHMTGKLNMGQAFEQTAFHYVSKNFTKNGFYYEKQREVDFIVETPEGKELWETKLEVKEDQSKYIEIAHSLKAKKVVFITMKEKKHEQINGIIIDRIPLWELLIKKAE